ncbi:hypothetical protein DXG01_005321 [Tephrocybe rancida]|nr:hypothetical protein DXG01_005321 [Tephrocybe rancida]
MLWAHKLNHRGRGRYYIIIHDYKTIPLETHERCLQEGSGRPMQFAFDDNVLFHIHRKNLETHAAGFPPSEFETCGEIVPLTEDTLTLERLFQYMYLKRHADIDLLPFEDLYKLAEAAEKYEAFSVMHLCKMGFK